MSIRSRLKKIALLILPLVLVAFSAMAAEEKKAPEPAPPPDHLSLKVKKMEGGEATLKELLKKNNTLVVFFQSACIACTTELSQLKADFPNDKVDVIGVGVDVRLENLKKYVEERSYPKVVLWDPNFDFAPHFNVSYTPAVVLLDKAGRMKGFFGGYTAETIKKIKESLQ